MADGYSIVNRALRLCRVVDAGSAATAEDGQDALDTLNAMLAEWHEAGIGVPDYSLATLGTSLASDVADREAIAYALAERLAPEYGQDLPPLALRLAVESMSRLRLRYFQPGASDFSELPSQVRPFDITNGDS